MVESVSIVCAIEVKVSVTTGKVVVVVSVVVVVAVRIVSSSKVTLDVGSKSGLGHY